MDNAAYTDALASYEGDLTIKGNDGAVLTLPSTVSLKGNLTLSNLTLSGASTIFANGYNLKIDETVTAEELSDDESVPYKTRFTEKALTV